MSGTTTTAGHDFYRRVARHAGLEFVDLGDAQINPLAARMLSPELCRQFQMLPISYANGVVTIASPEPPQQVAEHAETTLTGRAGRFVVAPEERVQRAIAQTFAPWPEQRECAMGEPCDPGWGVAHPSFPV